MHPLVVNVRYARADVYVGRGSPWGNLWSHRPSRYSVFMVASREEAVRRYEEWLPAQTELMALIPTLRAKKLGCYCAPLLCHAEILARLANR